MKRLLLILSIFVICSSSAFARTDISKTIGRIENSLYGIEYTNQNTEERLSRIEKSIYGEKSNGSINSRFNKLSKDISADAIGKEIEPKYDTFAEDEPTYVEPKVKEDASVDYLVVNLIEKKIFKKEFKNKEITERLASLEQALFKQTYAKEDLNSRVERLKTQLNIDTTVAENSSSNTTYNNNNEEYYYSDDIKDPYYNNNYLAQQELLKQKQQKTDDIFSDKALDNRNSMAKINSLEKRVFGQSFSNDTKDNRLTRLENEVFSTTFNQDDDNVRLKRLASATKAQKTSKMFDSNNFSQKMSTLLQVGTMILMIVAMVL